MTQLIQNMHEIGNSVIIDGIEVFYDNNYNICGMSECPGHETRSWESLLEFRKRFPVGDEPEWDMFLVKQSKKQDEDFDRVRRKFFEMTENAQI